MITTRTQEVALAILAGLSSAGASPLSEAIVHARANLKLRHAGNDPALQSEFTEALAWLDTSRHVIGTRGPLGNARWSISTAGRHLLADESLA